MRRRLVRQPKRNRRRRLVHMLLERLHARRCTVSTKRSPSCRSRTYRASKLAITSGVSATENELPMIRPDGHRCPARRLSIFDSDSRHSYPHEDADVADMVVRAGIDAARDIQLNIADVVQVIEVVETVCDLLHSGMGTRVRQRAEVAAGAADHVGQQTDVRRRQNPAWPLPAIVRSDRTDARRPAPDSACG